MAYALLTHTAKGSTGAGFPSSVTTAAISTVGANLIIVSRADFSNNDIAINDSAGNTWTNVINYQPATSNLFIAVYYCLNPITSATHTFTTPTDGNGNFPAIGVASFSGANATSPFDTSTTNTSALAASLQPGSITPPANGALLYACGSSLSTSTTITGMTVLDDVAFANGIHVGFTHGYVIQGSAAALNPTFNFSTSNLCSAVQADFLAQPASTSGAIYITPWFG